MSLTNSYLNSTKNLESIINSVINAKAPDKFTTKFLEDLGFKSSNDRLVIGVFKALGLIDENGQPLQRYYEFLGQTQTKKILAMASGLPPMNATSARRTGSMKSVLTPLKLSVLLTLP